MNAFLLRNIDWKQLIVTIDNAENPTIAPETYLILSGKDFVRKRSAAIAYTRQLLKKAPDEAAAILAGMRSNPAYDLSEGEMNQLGLELQEDGLHQAALETLKLNVLLFPTSFNVYNSYAEVLSKNGHKEAAIAMYRRSLALNPNNEGGKAALQRLNSQP